MVSLTALITFITVCLKYAFNYFRELLYFDYALHDDGMWSHASEGVIG